MSLGKRGMFGEARYKTLANIVKIDTIDNAEKATKELLKRFNEFERRDAKVRTKSATILAMNRAKVIANNTKSSKMRQDKLRISGIYQKALSKMKLD